MIIPKRKLYNYLTDRVGNFEEISPYFEVLRAVSIDEGLFGVFAVEHDTVSATVPKLIYPWEILLGNLESPDSARAD